MKYLFIDTETSGLHDYKLPADDPSQPRLAHLAMLWADDDMRELDRQDIYIQPAGWSMPQGPGSAGEINGLTDDFLWERGAPITVALDQYSDEIKRGLIVVAFNAQFDLKVMRGELRRAGYDDLFERTPNICVMRPMNKICGLKQPGSNRPKFPNLTEALDHFNIKPTAFKAHGAIDDVHGALLIAQKLKNIGALPEAAVHYAKEKPAGTPSKPRAATADADAGGFPATF